MSLKVVVLQSKEQIIADIKEVVSEDKPVAYLLQSPQIVSMNRFSLSEDKGGSNSIEVTLTPWILSSAEKDIPVPINHVVTIVEPLESIKEMYLEKTNGTRNQTDSSDNGTESDK
tara:strand:+ start:364 stop:708 length:345 start_codon:yes stop_codon:yes gene_type:complete